MLRRIVDTLVVTLVPIIGLLFFGLILKMFEPFWPMATGLFFAIVTVIAFDGDRWSKFMCIAGIAIYLASWPAANAWGVWPGVGLCAFGFNLWFLSFCRSLVPQARFI